MAFSPWDVDEDGGRTLGSVMTVVILHSSPLKHGKEIPDETELNIEPPENGADVCLKTMIKDQYCCVGHVCPLVNGDIVDIQKKLPMVNMSMFVANQFATHINRDQMMVALTFRVDAKKVNGETAAVIQGILKSIWDKNPAVRGCIPIHTKTKEMEGKQVQLQYGNVSMKLGF